MREDEPIREEVFRAREKWNAAHGSTDNRAQYAMSHPVVSAYVHDIYLGGKRPFGFLMKHLPKAQVSRGLELACGRGDLSLRIASAGVVGHIDAYDVSDQAIAKAREKASAREISNVTFLVEDVNEITLPEDTYDFVICSQSLHHIENLEHVYAEISKSLVPDGIFYVSDYMGPSRMQWTDAQLHVINEILRILPAEFRRLLAEGLGYTGTHKEVVQRVPVETYLQIDPSEGVRSAEILPLARRYFDIVEERATGGTISYELLRGIIHNFDANDDKDATILRLVLLLEKLLIEHGAIDSDFKFFVARKRRA